MKRRDIPITAVCVLVLALVLIGVYLTKKIDKDVEGQK